ncbi:MAG: MATE family efflux transporter [Rubellimicrobium sp.]|nr:MATE family efflux transporter [Rubellimicrobium sp.]
MTTIPVTPPTQTWGEHSRAILALGVPLIGSNLAQMVIGLTDTLMLGWYDVTALAAATLATSLYFLLFLMGIGFANAVAPLVAAAVSAGQEVEVRRVTRMAMWLSIGFGLVVIAPLMVSAALFEAIGQDPEVSRMAQEYLRIAGWGLIPALLVAVLRSYLSALELTGMILWATIGAAVLNALVNYMLIFGNWGAPELGIRGAAIASVGTASLTLVILLAYALWKVPQYRLLQRFWRPDWQAMGRVSRLGLPIGLTALAESGLFSGSAVLVGWIGTLELAAHGIALQLASAAFMLHLGLSQAVTVRAGRAMGRRDEAGLRRGAVTAYGISAAFSVATVVLFLTFAEPVVSLFVDPGDPRRLEVIAIGVTLVGMAALFNLVDGMQVVALGLLRGVQDAAVPMVHAAISYWLIGMPVSFLLGFTFGFGAVGVWAGLVVGLLAAAVLLSWRFWGRSVRIGRDVPLSAT